MTELAIGQVTERTGLSVHALRFYEKEGLLAAPVKRDVNGRRVYTEQDVEWLVNCTKFRASGMPLATIREFAALVREGPGNEEKRLGLLREHQNQVIGRIAELNDCLELISRKVEVYEDHVERGTADALWR
ncbi:MerR family transcriptional regulator [Amycolatopsis orientalis]|uniref:MerR family transcriptional regulator n=1 Tax=Amycolatopsis orientalis TaxID=31958 RepID=A0A193C9R5_AMYOR|nr:MerR family transcriptional regulator [Amycolatopsis orientalis]ANN21065.1 MerR family transcriptional regulator [Amycolatopsis orientalis]